MNFPHLFSPLKVGPYQLKHRVAMAPLTRTRAEKGVLITAGGFTGESAEAGIAEGHADAIAFGRIFISNPDLPSRLRHHYPLTPCDRKTFYGGDVAGYTDYPVYDAMAPA
jgi:2,4-dienoyl-CoA reductase-like NADH-dependent reductase (Old Yellow Enzyme family)